MSNFILTLLIGVIFGYIFYRLKVPGGMMVGSVFGVAIFNICFDMAYMPSLSKTIAQILAGAFIGCTVEKSDLIRLKYILKPVAILFTVYFILNISLGFIISAISPLDLATSFMCSVPGGISDIPLISADMGADVPKVTLLQFTRLVVGIGIFPSMIDYIGRKEEANQDESKFVRIQSEEKSAKTFILTIIVASVFGVIGKVLGIPAGVLVFSLLGTIAFKMLFNKSYLPLYMKRIAQVLSGSYIGCMFAYKDLLELKQMVLPVLVLIIGYSIACLIIGKLLNKFCGMSLKEGLLVGTPAGASDMALISSDMGVNSSDLIVLQVIRLVMAVSIFPQIINILLKILQ